MKTMMTKTASVGLLLLPLLVQAHGDEDHGAHGRTQVGTPAATATMAMTGEQPRRLPDGSIFLPKTSQRRLGVRTQVPVTQTLARSLELNGHVVMDPNFSGRVQSLQGGRLMAGPHGLPTLGQPVRRGEVLAQVIPAVSTLELATQQAQLADWQVQRQLAQKNLTRLQTLASAVPRKDIDIAEAELKGLEAKIATLGRGLERLEPLVAPVDGVIASAVAVNGQVVDAKETLFEIVDPQRLLIEAFAYDAQAASRITSASLQGSNVPLMLVGAAKALRDGALPLLFRVEAPAHALVLGQPVKLIAQTQDQLQGMPLPQSAVVSNSANEPVVWLHQEPERFRAQPVRVLPLDGEQVVVIGLVPGQRVVVQGATLLNQIR